MEAILPGLAVLVTLLALLAGGLWVAISLLVAGLITLGLFSDAPIGQVLATAGWSAANGWALAALPLFVWMGEILFRSRLAEDMFEGLSPWLERLPGGLVHINVLGSGLFAATAGSSAATAATIGRLTLPALAARGYDRRLSLGTLAGSATLGLLIPPSIILIVYGVATEQSIAHLFVAGILPGIMLMGLFSGYVIVWSMLNKPAMPDPGKAMGWRQRLRASRRLAPVAGLIAGVIGVIYWGLASPTDAAAIGVLLALLLSWRGGTLTRTTFMAGLFAAVRTSCMIVFIMVGAAVLTIAMGFAGIPQQIAAWIGGLGLSPALLIAALTLFYVALGCFLDGISMVLLTIAVVPPLVAAAGFDLVWFGIFLVLVVEMAQITPPVGFNLFVLRGLTGERIGTIARAAWPFFALLAVAIAIITLVPGIVTFLPQQMAG